MINQSEVKCAINASANQRAAGSAVSHTVLHQHRLSVRRRCCLQALPPGRARKTSRSSPQAWGLFYGQMNIGFLLWHCLVPSDNVKYRCVLEGKIKSSSLTRSLHKCAFCYCNAAYNINRASCFSKSSFTAI